MNDVTGFLPQPERRLITTRREYLDGMALVIGLARREIALFDPDLAAIDMNSAARMEQLGAFLAGNRDARLRIVVHDADGVRRDCPRLLSLLAQHAGAIAIHETEGEAQRAQDCFVLADAEHFVRRGVAAQPRGAIGLHDQREGRLMHDRFEEIWTSSVLAISATTLGL
jgi:hypothetical protein